MGCNTSKESVQPVGDEAKEDVKNGDISNAESSSTKVESQEASQKKSQEGKKEADSKNSNERKEEGKKEEKGSDKEREAAATRIQAAFRGHHARKSMKETESSIKQTGTKSNSEPTKEQLQQEFRADDKELCDAATKIQASFRGHMSRKEQATALAKSAENAVDNVVSKMEEKAKDAVNELEGIDLTDPDLHKAATKIQASFRGHKVRQEVLSNPVHDAPKN